MKTICSKSQAFSFSFSADVIYFMWLVHLIALCSRLNLTVIPKPAYQRLNLYCHDINRWLLFYQSRVGDNQSSFWFKMTSRKYERVWTVPNLDIGFLHWALIRFWWKLPFWLDVFLYLTDEGVQNQTNCNFPVTSSYFGGETDPLLPCKTCGSVRGAEISLVGTSAEHSSASLLCLLFGVSYYSLLSLHPALLKEENTLPKI